MAKVLDNVDKGILNELQENGRSSIVDLAERVHLTKTPCSERVKRLEREGFVRKYSAVLDPDMVQRGQVTLVQVSLSKTSENALPEFNRAVKKLPEVQGCYLIAGNFDYLLKVRTRDISHFRDVFEDKISKLPSVMQTHSFAVMETVKESTHIDMFGVDM
ncbi:Lrp/AsnC ligand binding domain-containing protein [Terasakiella sp. A23]|uniref:Lrp/AsnC ligand binding domain-containing protein n=1 Tax=Terasakiella sp. FCG-A23 TaxID=3080561 RepID=UPI002954156F|nr:Lrp/AsnC ligand binding domain-containing protein [Terasakiella sp. A23]MDV7341405.1 Lrp/AsnC ligand binding domain-containing protein [Terasakiella sp. A23]